MSRVYQVYRCAADYLQTGDCEVVEACDSQDAADDRCRELVAVDGAEYVHDLDIEPVEPIEVFKIGDFYEAFGEDAHRLAKIVGLVVTTRRKGDNSLPMSGFPYHQLANYEDKCASSGAPLVVLSMADAVAKYFR